MLSDERILGGDKFVERILEEADEKIKYQLSIDERRIQAEKAIMEMCRKEGVKVEELRGGSRRGRLSEIRSRLAKDLVEKMGLPLAEAGRRLGVSTSAISKILMRAKADLR